MRVEVTSTSPHTADVKVNGVLLGELSMAEGCAIIIPATDTDDDDEDGPFFGAFPGHTLLACTYAILMCVDGVESVSFNGECLSA